MITLNHIQKQFGSKILFRDCSLQIGVRDRLGLIGPNGSGKTTLLKILLGEEPVDGGEILIAKGVKIGHLPQEVSSLRAGRILEEVQKGTASITSLQDKMKILEEELLTIEDPEEQERLASEYGRLQEHYAVLGGYGLESEAKRILQGLGFEERDFGRFTDELSGGWLMRIALAKILLQSPDLLLLDEPTNHLDLQSLIWLEEFLANYPAAIIIISHDRSFLNHVINWIVEIDAQRLVSYHGNYDDYVAEKEARRRILEATYTTQQKKIEQMECFIERFRYKSTKARQVQSRIKMLEKLERVEVGEKQREVRFRFPSPRRSGQKVIEVKGLHKSYGDRKVYQGIDIALFRGDKVALVGPNGAGKSTLLKILAGVIGFEKGEVEIGKDVTRSYFAQYQLDLLHSQHTIFEEILEVATDETQTELRNLLGAFLFSGEEIEKKVSVLSGGEKSRLILARMLLKPANFLLLDEPTSHLDIPSRNVLGIALKQFQGTICFITHDRHLINRIANRVIEVNRGRLTFFLGNYDDYLYKKQQIQGMDDVGLPQPARKNFYQLREERKREAYQRDQYRRKLHEIEKKLHEVEKLLDESTRELDQLNQKLSEPSLYLNQKETYETLQTHHRAKQRVKDLSEHWESIALELEEAKKAGIDLN